MAKISPAKISYFSCKTHVQPNQQYFTVSFEGCCLHRPSVFQHTLHTVHQYLHLKLQGPWPQAPEKVCELLCTSSPLERCISATQHQRFSATIHTFVAIVRVHPFPSVSTFHVIIYCCMFLSSGLPHAEETLRGGQDVKIQLLTEVVSYFTGFVLCSKWWTQAQPYHLFSPFGWDVWGQFQSTPVLTFGQGVKEQFQWTPILTFWSSCSRTVSTNTCSHLLAKMFEDSFDQHLFSPFGRGVQGQFQCSCAAWWVPQLALDRCLWWSRSSHIPAGCTGQWTENPHQTLLAYRLQLRSSQRQMTMSKTSKESK